ncbi:hypothetical protein EPUS_00372 [Endocarpon pusillum Z07020]|uniref:Uncharacterized protein n=1 Tax=Endocarpon pusillum (strain Z07020 / HMAS-L-300199) TaxID=1263415 RepID=U1HMG2_ENDPU|nr:uncharacterized protein EPUS_00372 [Endocarpon pusillum Z07020]ERF70184.1 hypothetical protein EPUS_00372 [Endocarpon pusillum Z07020]
MAQKLSPYESVYLPDIGSKDLPTPTSTNDSISTKKARNVTIFQVHELEHGPSGRSIFRPWLRNLKTCWIWFIADSWALECISIVVASLALGIIGIGLAVYRERPAVDWRSSITSNSLLSVLATILRIFLSLPIASCLGQLKWIWYGQRQRTLRRFQIFDAASRGPWGALMLLWSIGFSHLASIACFITVFALANDAFIQQTIVYQPRPVNSNTTIPFSQSHNEFGRISRSDVGISQSLESAVLEGAFATKPTLLSDIIQAQCSTGDCTYPEFASLAARSRCVDVSALINETCATSPAGANNCTGSISLPNGLNLPITGNDYITVSTAAGLNINNFDQYQKSLANVSMLIYDTEVTDIEDGDTKYTIGRLYAYDCAISPSVNTYQSRVRLGQVTENITNSYMLNTASETAPWEVTIPQGSLQPNTNLTFSISHRASQALSQYLTKQLNGTGNSDAFSTDLVQALFLNGARHVPRTMEHIATAITNNMRLTSGQMATGTATSLESYIHVRWKWLLLPMCLILLMAIVLGLTMWQTHVLGLPNWRGNALATMAHGLQGYGGTAVEKRGQSFLGVRGDEKISELEGWAGRMGVRLRWWGWGRKGGVVDYGLVPAV